MNRLLERFRLKLASVDALLLLSVLGLLSGLVAGAVILAFRFFIESSQGSFLAVSDHYEGLSWQLRLLLPIAGGIIIGLILNTLSKELRMVGVVHVMERLNYHEGQLPWRNAVLQFFGAAISIISGHSVGREGPGVHLGAASGSLLGQSLHLPNNSTRTLVACGCAAAIAASFNTPLAGVIFAMEVIMMEYTIASFTPVILAAVSATVLTRLVYGVDPAFSVPMFELASLLEMPWIVVMGIAIGGLAALFNTLLKHTTGWLAQSSILMRCSVAGVITGLIAVAFPQIMGIGYDTVTAAMLGQLGIGLLAGILVAKLLATTASIGLGIPGGLIAPVLFIGAIAGGIIGAAGGAILPETSASVGLYVVLGMAAMMAATLQAPLAALMALLELTGNPNIILPGMLAVIAATLTSSELFGREGVFVMLLRSRGLDYRSDPVTQTLRRIGVTSQMNRDFVRHGQFIANANASEFLANSPRWIIVELDNQPVALLPVGDLQRYLEDPQLDRDAEIDLLEIPAQRLQLAGIHRRATLQEATQQLDREQAEALYVWRTGTSDTPYIEGIITRATIHTAQQGVSG